MKTENRDWKRQVRNQGLENINCNLIDIEKLLYKITAIFDNLQLN